MVPLWMLLATVVTFGSQITGAVPWKLGRPVAVPEGHNYMAKRAESSDPSCPEGYLCEHDREQCPGGTICPSDTSCINFAGALACAPVINHLSFCALNPDTYSAVACPDNGICCHGQCYLQGSVCCENVLTVCTLGELCNACPSGNSCGPRGLCLGRSTTSTSQTSTDVPTSSGPSLPVSLSSTSAAASSSTITESTVTTTTSSTTLDESTTTSSSIAEPTETFDFAAFLELIDEITNDYLDLVIICGEIVEELETWADEVEKEEEESGGNEQRIRKRNPLLVLAAVARAASAVSRLAQLTTTAASRAEYIPLNPVNAAQQAAIRTQTSRLQSNTGSLLGAISDIRRQIVPTLPSLPIRRLRGLFRARVVVPVGVGLAGTAWVWNQVRSIIDFLDSLPPKPTESQGSEPTRTIQLPPLEEEPTATEPVPEPSETEALPSLPDDYIVMMNKDTGQFRFVLQIVQCILQGGVILGIMAEPKVGIWNFRGLITDPALHVLDLDPQVRAIARNAELIDTRDTPSNEPDEDAEAIFAVPDDSEDLPKVASESELSSASLESRQISPDFQAKRVWYLKDSVEKALFNSFHWMNSIWEKKALSGSYYDMPDFSWRPSDFMPTRPIRVYLLDRQVDWRHPELSDYGIRTNYDCWECTSNGCIQHTGIRDVYVGREDDKYHGTAMAAYIIGRHLGGAPDVEMVPIAWAPGRARAWTMVQALGKMEELQAGAGDPRAIINWSGGFKNRDLKVGGTTYKSHDVVGVAIGNLRDRGVDVVASAGNFGDLRVHAMSELFPTSLGGSNGQVITVGSCDFGSNRRPDSSFVFNRGEPLPNNGFPDIYNAAAPVVLPYQAERQGPGSAVLNFVRYGEGTSAAAALTTALLARILAKEGDNAPAPGMATKRLLKQIAISRKGLDFASDTNLPPVNTDPEVLKNSIWMEANIPDPGAANNPYIAPRAATNWEMECLPEDLPGGPLQNPYHAESDYMSFTGPRAAYLVRSETYNWDQYRNHYQGNEPAWPKCVVAAGT